MTVTAALEVLERRLGAGLLGFGEGILAAAISAEDARRWACDAHLAPIVLGAEGAPPDIGRRSRIVPRSLCRAQAVETRAEAPHPASGDNARPPGRPEPYPAGPASAAGKGPGLLSRAG
ncbi:hypothetical protein [Pseudonocardia sp. H11422]|uniref:hypothetical protein n=1 Tax=Pseudonocardia sp. H11422 TaxID=2835866 RepID=UPI003977D8D7